MSPRLLLFALLTAGLLAACATEKPAARSDVTALPQTAPAAQPEPDSAIHRVAVVPKAVSQQFWTTVEAGAQAAGDELGAQIIWDGPDSETDVSGQKNIIEDFITQQVDAIVLAATDAEALVSTIQDAQTAGIPVVVIDSGVNTDVASYVATDNVAGARVAGETLLDLIGGSGKVGLIPFVKGAQSSEEREQGFREAVAEANGVELVAVDYSESDESKARAVTADMLTSQPDLAGIFAANEAGVVGAALAIQQAGKQGQVKLVGFDGSPTEQELLREGVVQALVVQNPFRMGYEGVRAAMAMLNNETVEERIDTGVTVVTAENIDEPDIQKLLNPQAEPGS